MSCPGQALKANAGPEPHAEVFQPPTMNEAGLFQQQQVIVDLLGGVGVDVHCGLVTVNRLELGQAMERAWRSSAVLHGVGRTASQVAMRSGTPLFRTIFPALPRGGGTMSNGIWLARPFTFLPETVNVPGESSVTGSQ